MRDDDVKREMEQYEKKLESIPVPDELLSKAITEGVGRAKTGEEHKQKEFLASKKRNSSFFKKAKWGWVVAAVLFVLAGCTFAVYLVHPDFFVDNSSWKHALEHEYYVEMDQTDVDDGVKVTLNGAIVDERSFVGFVTTETDEKYEDVAVSDVRVTSPDGEEIEFSGSYGPAGDLNDKPRKTFRDRLDLYFTEDGVTAGEFELVFDLYHYGIAGPEKIGTYAFPIDLRDVEIAKKRSYELDEVLDFAGSDVVVERVEVYPTHAEVHVYFPELNDLKFFDFPDLMITDEKGRTWGKVTNGLTGLGPDEADAENRQILIIGSEYFTDDVPVYLSLQKAQTLPKSQAQIVYDLDKGEVIAAPENGETLKKFQVNKNSIEVEVETPFTEDDHHFVLLGEVSGEDGKPLETIGHHFYFQDGMNVEKVMLEGLSELSGEITVKLNYYPNWVELEEEVKIPLK